MPKNSFGDMSSTEKHRKTFVTWQMLAEPPVNWYQGHLRHNPDHDRNSRHIFINHTVLQYGSELPTHNKRSHRASLSITLAWTKLCTTKLRHPNSGLSRLFILCQRIELIFGTLAMPNPRAQTTAPLQHFPMFAQFLILAGNAHKLLGLMPMIQDANTKCSAHSVRPCGSELPTHTKSSHNSYHGCCGSCQYPWHSPEQYSVQQNCDTQTFVWHLANIWGSLVHLLWLVHALRLLHPFSIFHCLPRSWSWQVR